QYQSWVTIVRRYLTPSSRSIGAGGTGSIGTIHAATEPSLRHASSSQPACTECPPRIRRDATTTTTRSGFGREFCIRSRCPGPNGVQGTRRQTTKYARISELLLTIGRRATVAAVRERLSVCAYRIEITAPKH